MGLISSSLNAARRNVKSAVKRTTSKASNAAKRNRNILAQTGGNVASKNMSLARAAKRKAEEARRAAIRQVGRSSNTTAGIMASSMINANNALATAGTKAVKLSGRLADMPASIAGNMASGVGGIGNWISSLTPAGQMGSMSDTLRKWIPYIVIGLIIIVVLIFLLKRK